MHKFCFVIVAVLSLLCFGCCAFSEDDFKADIYSLMSTNSVDISEYNVLSEGSTGSDVFSLEKFLYEKGYMVSEPDYDYDSVTVDAVSELQEYIVYQEQCLIDAHETPVSHVEDDGSGMPRIIDVPIVVYKPLTEINGVADALLQAYIYSDKFEVSNCVLSVGSSGDSVLRLQCRLQSLGYLIGDVDGFYGENTARSVLLFKKRNGLSLGFDSSLPFQSYLFSDVVLSSDDVVLSVGLHDDAVLNLQNDLYRLGFLVDKPDGVYGSLTEEGVSVAQAYLKEKVSDGEFVVVNGVADFLFVSDLKSGSLNVLSEDLLNGSSGLDVERVQRRLSGLGYYYGVVDGVFGNGTEKALISFQSRNDLPETGVVDRCTQVVLFSDSARYGYKPYKLVVSVSDQKVYAYALDGNDEYSVLVRTMVCSTGKKGTATPIGTYESSTCPEEKWHYFKKFGCWAQYAYRIEGNILFHSVLFSQKGGRPTSSSVRALGKRASHGCVRLSVDDAKWIWSNCPAHTIVVVE